jgi:CspA family cold shock protein
MAHGSVQSFNSDKSERVIAVDGGQDVNVRFSNIVEDKDRFLEEGQRVEFGISTGPKGQRAEQIRVVE